jgi:Domain of unknown function (DUF4190)/GYF domain 2
MYRIIGADGKEYGPVSADQLRRWIVEGRADANTRIAVEGSTEWRALRTFAEFAYLLPPAPLGPVTGPVRQTNSMAVAAMVMGICSLVFCLCCYGTPFNVLGIVFSIIALNQIRSEPERYSGKNMAVAGLALCVLSIVLSIIFLVIAGVSSGWHDMSRPTYKL